jgi:site-specific DNA-methyltransferase (adenine-specific)
MSHESKTTVFHGDCLPLLRNSESETAQLVYLDPPFFTQKAHRQQPRDRSREFSFDDTWTSLRDYGQFILLRLAELRRVLSPRGSIFFHCDRNAAHICRLMLDDVFGSDNFRAEIIWCFRRWSNSRQGLLPAHQTIYHYSKSGDYTFNQIWTDYSPATNVEQILQRRTRDDSNKSIYQRDSDGGAVFNGVKRGVPLSDVWDIPFLNPKARERTGYPTQKPLLLLERIIEIATNEGDHVIDPFCGSGTTLVAAQHLSRSATGIDKSADAVEIARRRLRDPVRSDSRLLSVGRDTYRVADESLIALLRGIDVVAVQRNSGMDALLKCEFGGGPIPVRIQRPEETIAEAAGKLVRACKDKHAKVMFLIIHTRGGSFDFADDLPDSVVAIEAPSLLIRQKLRELDAIVPVLGETSR